MKQIEEFMFKLISKPLVIVLTVLLCNLSVFPVETAADINPSTNQNSDIEAPQSRLSPEMEILPDGDSTITQWIVNHKWWVLVGLSFLACTAVLLSQRHHDSSDNNSNTPVTDNGVGEISVEW